MKKTIFLFTAIFTFLTVTNSSAQVFLAGENPGTAKIKVKTNRKITLSNKVLDASFSITNGTLSALIFESREAKTSSIDFHLRSVLSPHRN